jgi:hypothetical protein
MDCLKSVMHVLGQAFFPPDKVNYNLPLKLAYMILKTLQTDFKRVKPTLKKTKSGPSNIDGEQMK